MLRGAQQAHQLLTVKSSREGSARPSPSSSCASRPNAPPRPSDTTQVGTTPVISLHRAKTDAPGRRVATLIRHQAGWRSCPPHISAGWLLGCPLGCWSCRAEPRARTARRSCVLGVQCASCSLPPGFVPHRPLPHSPTHAWICPRETMSGGHVAVPPCVPNSFGASGRAAAARRSRHSGPSACSTLQKRGGRGAAPGPLVPTRWAKLWRFRVVAALQCSACGTETHGRQVAGASAALRALGPGVTQDCAVCAAAASRPHQAGPGGSIVLSGTCRSVDRSFCQGVQRALTTRSCR